MCVCAFLDRAREATRDRATHGIVCALSMATRVAVVVVAAVACVVVACVCACACVCCSCVLFSVSLLDRAREATRDRATHGGDCARPTARCVVAVVAAACVAVACVCVCFVLFSPHS